MAAELISHEKHGVGNGSADSASGAAALPSGPAAICLPGLSPKTKKLHTQHAKKFRVRWGARGKRGGGGKKTHMEDEKGGRRWESGERAADQSFIINKNPIGALNRDQ